MKEEREKWPGYATPAHTRRALTEGGCYESPDRWEGGRSRGRTSRWRDGRAALRSHGRRVGRRDVPAEGCRRVARPGRQYSVPPPRKRAALAAAPGLVARRGSKRMGLGMARLMAAQHPSPP